MDSRSLSSITGSFSGIEIRFSSGVTSSSMVISPEGRFWVITLSTLGEPGPLEVGEANLTVGVAIGSVSGSDISSSSLTH